MTETIVTQSTITDGLRALGVAPGDVLLVHSSLKRFGRVEGGMDTVIDALLTAVGPTGTVMVPTLTGTASHGPDDPPLLDVRATPCWTGLIPETFRQRPDAVRSLHPTHSVAAIGPHAAYLVRDHFTCGSPCGPDSPYLRLAELRGKVLFLGVTLDCCTLLHGIEELADCRYHMQPAPSPGIVIDAAGISHPGTFRLHQWGTPRRFTVVEPLLIADGLLTRGRIGNAHVRLLDAHGLVTRISALLHDEPRYLVNE